MQECGAKKVGAGPMQSESSFHKISGNLISMHGEIEKHYSKWYLMRTFLLFQKENSFVEN